MSTLKRFVLFFLFAASVHSVSAQMEEIDSTYFPRKQFSVGAGCALNVAILQSAPDFRLYAPLTPRVQLFGEFHYFGINAKNSDTTVFKEYAVNLNIKRDFFLYKRWRIYITAGILYLNWLNANEPVGAKSYYGVVAGVGVQYEIKRFSLFSEQQTNSVFLEYISVLGLRMNFNPPRKSVKQSF